MAADPHQRRAITRLLAALLSGLAVSELVATVALALANGSSFGATVGAFTVTNGAMALSFTICAVLLAWQRPGSPIGWLFLAAGTLEATSACAIQCLLLGVKDGWALGALRLLGSVFAYSWPWAVGFLLPLTLLLFPEGRTLGGRWRWLVPAAVAEGMLFVASFANPAPQQFGRDRLTLYLTVPGYARLGPLWALSTLGFAAVYACAIAALVIRYRRGDEKVRRQLLWLLLATVVVLAYVAVVWGIFSAGPILGLLVLTLIPASVTVAVLRHQLLDIQLVVTRALGYGLLTLGTAAVYVLTITLLDLLVRTRVSLGAAVAASVVVAFGFNPGRVRLQRLIDRAFYGDRRDPVRTVSLVGQRLAGPGTAGLASVLQAVCQSLRLPYAEVRAGSVAAAVHGAPPTMLHAFPLSYDGGQIGELVVGLRAGQGRLSPPDIAVLELLAGPLTVALYATTLSAALQESRLGIVAAREEERRRLRRDLHDGIGPVLTGIAFKADAARNVMTARPAQSDELLAGLREDITSAIADIRQLVYDLRPPALDDLGLVGALREQSGRLAQRADGGSVPVRISAPDSLPPLPAAVEVAAFRIITEAMTNAARHSGASSIEVRLEFVAGAGLVLEVRDNGAAAGGAWKPGVGLVSIRERVAELGGSCEAGPDPAGGGRVTASLPWNGHGRPLEAGLDTWAGLSVP